MPMERRLQRDQRQNRRRESQSSSAAAAVAITGVSHSGRTARMAADRHRCALFPSLICTAPCLLLRCAAMKRKFPLPSDRFAETGHQRKQFEVDRSFLLRHSNEVQHAAVLSLAHSSPPFIVARSGVQRSHGHRAVRRAALVRSPRSVRSAHSDRHASRLHDQHATGTQEDDENCSDRCM